MKFFEARDFSDAVILRSQDKKDVIVAFKERYPEYDIKYVDPFIYELDIHFTECMPEYEGILSRKRWNSGRIQKKVCKVIRHTIERLGKEHTAVRIAKLWRIDPFEIKKDYKKFW